MSFEKFRYGSGTMFKKAGWFFVGVYTLVILYLNIAALVRPGSDGFSLSTIFSIILMLLPASVIGFELSGKKVPIIIILIPLLITAVFFLGVVKFNSMGIETLAKALFFGITLLILGYMIVRRIMKK